MVELDREVAASLSRSSSIGTDPSLDILIGEHPGKI